MRRALLTGGAQHSRKQTAELTDGLTDWVSSVSQSVRLHWVATYNICRRGSSLKKEVPTSPLVCTCWQMVVVGCDGTILLISMSTTTLVSGVDRKKFQIWLGFGHPRPFSAHIGVTVKRALRARRLFRCALPAVLSAGKSGFAKKTPKFCFAATRGGSLSLSTQLHGSD